MSAAPNGAPRVTGFIPLLQLFERLALLGYSFDLGKWETLVNAGLLNGVPPAPSNDCQIPHVVEERMRHILDVEKKLAPGAGIDKLAFYLAINGLEDVPARLVVDYIEASVTKFFVVGDGMLRRLERKPARIGVLGEQKLADAMARAVLHDYLDPTAPTYVACKELLATGFVLYFRSTWHNKKLSPRRQWLRIITPDFLDYQVLPVKTIAEAQRPASEAPDPNMPPAADKTRIFARLRNTGEGNPRELLQAVKDAATVISAAAPHYPELAERADNPQTKAAFAQWALTLITPLLAAALFQVSQSTGDDKFLNLIADRKETGLEGVLRTVLVYWHT